MLLTKTVSIKLTKLNREYYQQKGYDISQKIIVVNTLDLKENCTTMVEIKCDYCGKSIFAKMGRLL